MRNENVANQLKGFLILMLYLPLAFLGLFLTLVGVLNTLLGEPSASVTLTGLLLIFWPLLIPSVLKETIRQRRKQSSNGKTISKSSRIDASISHDEGDFTLSGLKSLDPTEFEHLVADLWSEIGWSTEVTPGSNDKGIDVVAKKKDPYPQKVLIQAKRYSSNNKVSSKEIQQYSSLKHQEDKVDEVIVITTSSFTKNAIELASDLNVKLIHGRKLKQMLNKHLSED